MYRPLAKSADNPSEVAPDHPRHRPLAVILYGQEDGEGTVIMPSEGDEGAEAIMPAPVPRDRHLDVARHDPANLPEIVASLDLSNVDAIVLSACVQMPSLPAVAKVEALTGKPVVTAAIATTYAMLKALDLEPIVPGAGALLSGAY